MLVRSIDMSMWGLFALFSREKLDVAFRIPSFRKLSTSIHSMVRSSLLSVASDEM